jgi:hypothetical protein
VRVAVACVAAAALVAAAGLGLHAGRPLADPICVQTDPVSVLGQQVLPGIDKCSPVA